MPSKNILSTNGGRRLIVLPGIPKCQVVEHASITAFAETEDKSRAKRCKQSSTTDKKECTVR
jgi:hypothetical protein